MNDETKALLSEPLDRSKVATLSFGGRKLSYLEGWYVISAANGIFGFDGWSHEVISVDQVGPDLYTARVSVTALGVTRTDIGTGRAASDTAEAHETAIKGAATDGLKRALRTFGAQFGNDLYDKTAGQSAPPQGQQRPQETRSAPEHSRDAGFANLGALRKWAFDEHKLPWERVLQILGVENTDAIALDTAQVDIEASLGVATGASR